jgi:hypothetical protein
LKENPVTLTQSDLNELLDAIRAGGDINVVRKGVELALIEVEATEHIGAARYERSESRTTQRNGHRNRLLATKAGDVELKIPKLRQGQLLPLDPGAAAPHRPGAVRGGDGGLRARRVEPARWTTSSSRWALPVGSPRARCPGSAPAWTARWPPSGPAARSRTAS